MPLVAENSWVYMQAILSLSACYMGAIPAQHAYVEKIHPESIQPGSEVLQPRIQDQCFIAITLDLGCIPPPLFTSWLLLINRSQILIGLAWRVPP